MVRKIYIIFPPWHLLVSRTTARVFSFLNQQEERLALLIVHICLHKIQCTVRSVGNVGSCASKQNESTFFYKYIYSNKIVDTQGIIQFGTLRKFGEGKIFPVCICILCMCVYVCMYAYIHVCMYV